MCVLTITPHFDSIRQDLFDIYFMQNPLSYAIEDVNI